MGNSQATLHALQMLRIGAVETGYHTIWIKIAFTNVTDHATFVLHLITRHLGLLKCKRKAIMYYSSPGAI